MPFRHGSKESNELGEAIPPLLNHTLVRRAGLWSVTEQSMVWYVVHRLFVMKSLGRHGDQFPRSVLCILDWTYGAATLKACTATLVCHWLGRDKAEAC